MKTFPWVNDARSLKTGGTSDLRARGDEQTFRNPVEDVQSDGESVPVKPFGIEDEVLTDDVTDEGDVAEPANQQLRNQI